MAKEIGDNVHIEDDIMKDDSNPRMEEYVEKNQDMLLDSPGQMGGNGVMFGEDRSELDKIFEHMTNPANLHHYTELNVGEITAFSTLSVLAKKYNVDIYKSWIIENLKLRVSKKREGRKELVKVTARNPSNDFMGMQGQGGPSKWDMFRR